MTRIDAFTRLVARAVASGDKSFIDEVDAMLGQGGAIPPTAVGVLGGRSADLAHQVEKNGYAVPEWRSDAMQLLLFRVVAVLEAFEGVVTESRELSHAPPIPATADRWETGARLLKILGEIWELAAWEDATPGSIMDLMMHEAQGVKILRDEMNKVDVRRNALVEVNS